MFQTIGHKSGGFVQVSYSYRQDICRMQSPERIEALLHGERKTFKSVTAAKRWLTIQHRAWVAERTTRHHAALNGST